MTTMLVAQGHSHIRIVWHNYLFLHDRYERKSKSLFLLGEGGGGGIKIICIT